MSNTTKSVDASLEKYLKSLHSSSDKNMSYLEFRKKAISILQQLDIDVSNMPASMIYTTLSQYVKSGRLDIHDIHYIVDNNTFWEGFREHILSTMSEDMSTLKNRTKRNKPTTTFDSLDSIVSSKLSCDISSIEI